MTPSDNAREGKIHRHIDLRKQSPPKRRRPGSALIDKNSDRSEASLSSEAPTPATPGGTARMPTPGPSPATGPPRHEREGPAYFRTSTSAD